MNQPLQRWTHFCVNHGDQRVFSIWNNHKCLSQLFLIHLNTYVMVYDHYKYFNSFGAGIFFIRQGLTSVDVRFWRLKTVPAPKGLIETGDKTHLLLHRSRTISAKYCWILTSKFTIWHLEIVVTSSICLSLLKDKNTEDNLCNLIPT